MNMQKSMNNDTLDIWFIGKSDFTDYRHLEEISAFIKNSSTQLRSVSVHLEKMEFIDSNGLGMLLVLKERCNELGITIALRNAQGQVLKMLNASRIDECFGDNT
jgi:anti-anti-sigma factor